MKDNVSKNGSDTRERILDAAEVLFMEHGFDGTSMRMITVQAAVNLAAVNYHFGSKELLIQDVFRRRLTDLNKARLEALDALERQAGDAPVKPSRIVDAFFGTALRMAADVDGGGHTFMRLLGRTYTEPNEFVRKFLAEEYAECVERFLAAELVREQALHLRVGEHRVDVAGALGIQIEGAVIEHLFHELAPGGQVEEGGLRAAAHEFVPAQGVLGLEQVHDDRQSVHGAHPDPVGFRRRRGRLRRRAPRRNRREAGRAGLPCAAG